MSSKTVILIIGALLAAIFVSFVTLSPSYKNALGAKFYYEMGDYETAYKLSKSAYHKDIYNKLAHTVMVQSEISQKYALYIARSNGYLENIQKISKSGKVSKVNLDKIRMMCDIAVSDYAELKPSNLTDSDLQEEAKRIKDKFLTLQKELF
ncbi:hypothetical protein CSHOW_1570 [Campylobacter showae]|jgi:hypothetical protein|uniref:Uncharacterized protein n=1 Tax=Campylobacter showae RM3277 TaxID=553219 RepID=C6RIR5_9BACT|nr:hypothetical protein [Campylobacter showae]EET78808.1 hypothetical protein CAMSH0001_1412 [Campylobacter showae RM3277]QCD49478.1 hypothetical protein CSHOW_1570 [Campylobacter showae]